MQDDSIIKFIASVEEEYISKIWDTLENYLDYVDYCEWYESIFNVSYDSINEKMMKRLRNEVQAEFNKLKKTPYISLLKICKYDSDKLSSLLAYHDTIERNISRLFYDYIEQIYSEETTYYFLKSIIIVIDKYLDTIKNKIEKELKKIPIENIFPNSEDYNFWENYCVNLQSYQLNGWTYEVERATILPTIESVVAKINPYWLQLIYLYKFKEFYEENNLESIIEYDINSKSDNSYLINSITNELLDDIRIKAESEGPDITFEG